MATRINVNGTRVAVAPINGTSFSLPELHEVVGGYIEAFYLRDGLIMMLNEDGKRLGLAINRTATLIADANGLPADNVIVGDVIIGTRREFGGPNDDDDES